MASCAWRLSFVIDSEKEMKEDAIEEIFLIFVE